MIEVKQLVKRYDEHIAVDHLNFTIEKGRIYGFLGPNGAGKSTTMNMMTGYLGATEGEIFINGHNILTDPDKAKKDIGYLPEQPPLYTDMTVMEYLLFVFALKRVEKRLVKEQLLEIMQMLKLESVKNRLIRNLSKGYKQRVGLAAALAGFPEILILDEPTVGLDPYQMIEIRELIRSLSKDHTILLSSHILSEVREVCDHILILYQGKLVASDTPEHLEQKVHENQDMELVVKGNPEQCKEILTSVPSILSCQFTDTAESDCTRILLSAQKSCDLREPLFWAFAKHQLPILTMTPSRTTLEDIFLELTSSQEIQREIEKEDSTDESNL